MNRLFGYEFDQLFDNIFSVCAPTIWDIKQNDNEYTISIDVPGYTTKDLDIQVTSRILTIKGQHPRGKGMINRSITLDDSVDLKGITADLRDGVLYIRLIKTENAKPCRIEIKT